MINSHLPSTIALSCFASTARHLSVTLAAQELCLTQSAVSRQIKRLEEQLECILFLRVKQRLVLTEAGEEYAAQVIKYLSLLNGATAQLKSARKKQLRVGAEPSLTTRWLLPLLTGFQQKYPDVELDFATDVKNLYGAKLGFDIAILYGEGHWQGFECEFLLRPQMFAVCAPELLKKHGKIVQKADILRYPFLHHMAPDTPSDLSATQQWLKSVGLNNSEMAALSSQQYEHFQFLLDAALHGLGITVLPGYLIQIELDSGRLVKASETPMITDSYYIAIRKDARDNVNCQRFKTWLLETVKDLKID